MLKEGSVCYYYNKKKKKKYQKSSTNNKYLFVNVLTISYKEKFIFGLFIFAFFVCFAKQIFPYRFFLYYYDNKQSRNLNQLKKRIYNENLYTNKN